MLRLRKKLTVVLAVLLCAMLTLSTALLLPKNKSASAYGGGYVYPEAIGEIYKGNNKFDLTNLKALYSAIAPGATDIEDIDTRLSLSKNVDNTVASKNVIIEFGGKKWTAVYLSKAQHNLGGVSPDNSIAGYADEGDIVLTLWLVNPEPEADNTSQWQIWTGSSSPTDRPNAKYPANMYSTSYIRSQALNNGGAYWNQSTASLNNGNDTLITDESSISQKSANKYANFTMANGTYTDGTVANSVVDFLVSPRYIDWQYEQHASSGVMTDSSNFNYDMNNEAWGTMDKSKFYAGYYYADKEGAKDYYSVWKDDLLWLPSLTETGWSSYNKSPVGIWQTSQDQRSSISVFQWPRGANTSSTIAVMPLTTEGNSSNSHVGLSYLVRPALHLNLTKVAGLTVPANVSNPYNGKTQTLSDLTEKPSWYNENLYDNVTIKVDYPANMLEVGEYTVTATLLNTEDYYWADGNTSSNARTFKYTITKAPLNMQTLKVDENGDLQGDGSSVNEILTNIYLSTLLFERDVGKSTAPQFGLQYKRASGGSWTNTPPEVAGQYYVRAYIINEDECNYYLNSDGQASFIKPKEYVETPHFIKEGLDASQIAGTTLTVQYTGDYQEFKLVNTLDNTLIGVTVGERTGGLSYDQKTGTFRAKAVGTYTVEALLEDGGANTQWDSSAEELSRVITLIITKAELTVNILESDMTSWTKGDIDYLTVQVSGVKNGEAVKLDVYYQVKGNDAKTYVADSSMTLEGDTITVIVNLATFDSNKEYQLYVSLRENISANDNYTLINNLAPYEFFIMTATIKDEEVIEAWTISNLITGTQDAENNIEVDYNGLAYTMSLDASKLIKGLEPTYSNESNTDANSYTTTVLLTCLPGYQLASGKSSISFEITWKINPITFDIANLIWADNPEWSDDVQEISIINLPIWLQGNAQPGGTYWQINVGKYSASYALFSDGNYTFTYSGEDNEHYVIENSGQQATLYHDWEITKKIINVTNAPKQWTTKTVSYFEGDSYVSYDIYIPTDIELDAIKVTYWEDYSFSTSVTDMEKVAVDYQNGKTYYIKIEIAEQYVSTYEMYNTLTGENFAYTSFMVGGNKIIIEVVYESEDELQYNEQAQNIKATYRTLEFNYVYYDIDGSSSPLEGAPTEIGNYRVVVEVAGSSATYYYVQNNVFYFSIVKLVLNTNGYKPATANELKESIVIAEVDVDVENYFEYQIFNKNNTRVYEPLDYNTTYTVKLVIKDSVHAVWAEDAVTTYTFTTSFNPNVDPQYFNDPTITVTDKDGKEVNSASVVWTGEEFTITIDGWDNLSQFATVTVNGAESSGTFTLSDVGVYEIIITLSEDAIAADIAGWLWDSGSPSKIVEFEITKRYVAIPVATDDELEYNGEMQYLFPEGYEEDYIVLGGDEVVSSVDAGEWTVTLSLKNKEYSCWADGTTDDLTFSWGIAKAKIEGSWVDNDSYTEFVSEFASKLDTTYWDKDGNEVAFEDLVDGESYTAKVAIREEYSDNYEFADGVELEHEFTYVDTGILIITGSWVENDDGTVEFTPNTSAFADKFTTKYYDEDGKEVSVEDMVDGEEYTAKITVKEEYKDSYKFADSVEVEHKFTYTAPEPEEDLEEKKQEAKDALEEFAKAKKKEIEDNPNLTDEEKQEAKDKIDEELQKGKDAIDSATDAEGVEKAEKDAEGKIGKIVEDVKKKEAEAELEKKKQEAKDALDELAEEKKKEIDENPDMTDEEKKAAKDKVDEELQKGKDEIDKAKDADGVDKARKTAEDNIRNADKKGKSFPWWIFAVIAGALALIVIFLIIIIRRRNKEEEVDDYYDDEYDYDEDEEDDDEDDYDDEYDDGYDDY